MKKKSFIKKRQMSGEMSLQITSMADIFTILLVFLLKSYATGVNVSPTAGMLLPEAHAAETQIEALKVEVSANAVQVEGKPVAQLKNFVFDANDLEANGSSKALGAAFDTERKRQLLIAKNNADVKVDARIIVVADKRLPYSALKTVLASSALHGYTDFKLAVIKGE